MPLYEYRCRSCGKDFEALVNSSDTPTCPDCDSRELDKKFSVFAKPAASIGTAADFSGSCTTCGSADGPGSCGLS